jgi:hypothetical protein
LLRKPRDPDGDALVPKASGKPIRQLILVALKLIGEPFGGQTEVVVTGFDEFRCFLGIIFGERSDQKAFLREAKIAGGAQALPGGALGGSRLRRARGRTIIPVARAVLHGQTNPTEPRRDFA